MNIEELSVDEFEEVFPTLLKKINEDPIKNFIEAPGFLDFTPSPAQKVALKIIFGQELDNTTKYEVRYEDKDDIGEFALDREWLTEVELFSFMTGKDYNPNDKDIINKINLIIGRRGGKTTIASMLAIYCAIRINWKPFLHKTPFASVLVLSHSRDFSDEVIELIRTLIENSPVLRRLINKEKRNTTSTMNLKIPFVKEGTKNKIEYSRVQIKTGTASSKTTRGVAACAVLCDEISFWNLDENLKETDAKILKAVRPALKQFGDYAYLIKLSSPGIKQGVLYNEYQKWKKGELPNSYMVLKASSWVWNMILPDKEFKEEYELDPDGFDSEYRANFVDSLSNFISPEFVDMATLKGVKFRTPDVKDGETIYKAAIDAAYKGDTFTFSIVGNDGERVKQFILKGWKGSRKEPVKSSEVAKYIRTVCREFGISEVLADQYAFQPLREIFETYGITLVERTFSNTLKKQIYFNIKRLILAQQMDLLDSSILSKELKELIVEQTGTGNIKIGHPPGGSDDYSDATALAAFSAVEDGGKLKYSFESEVGSEDYGIERDLSGRCFKAPPPSLLEEYFGYAIEDNSSQYREDPETGKLKKASDFEEDDIVGPEVIF